MTAAFGFSSHQSPSHDSMSRANLTRRQAAVQSDVSTSTYQVYMHATNLHACMHRQPSPSPSGDCGTVPPPSRPGRQPSRARAHSKAEACPSFRQ